MVISGVLGIERRSLLPHVPPQPPQPTFSTMIEARKVSHLRWIDGGRVVVVAAAVVAAAVVARLVTRAPSPVAAAVDTSAT